MINKCLTPAVRRHSSLRAELRKRAGIKARSIVAVNAFAPLVAFLGFDRQRRDRTRLKPLQCDRLAGFLAITIGAVFYALQRSIDLGNQLALAVTGPQFNCPIGLRRRPVGKIGMILALVLKMLQRLLGFLEDILAPVEQLQAEILPLPLVHERLFVGRSIQAFFQSNAALALTVHMGLVGGST